MSDVPFSVAEANGDRTLSLVFHIQQPARLHTGKEILLQQGLSLIRNHLHTALILLIVCSGEIGYTNLG